ncbi:MULTISPECIES: APH(3') family aminoglycoside O-phosphotransferase [unclassified Crossiella]|uniref:APH(3') family aminoglycoside O-phosphotransferase n=1 Tax=unclassified Crossiella TaxID=2620835 RepID=UPI001FFED0DF|nr:MULTISPECIES: APH(3') family aminoglycoside O-phosphotransferase [unclassified Crossiella]MCK2240211.1 aminoglycoside 3'-phosphotransferase [Crossiella sp. S99.2]MCK2253337.1 aminoglycoside 3'-phosphotransferase [Crossiella sp. S99.1]
MADLITELGARYGRDWTPVTVGESGARVWRTAEHYLKIALTPPHPDPAAAPAAEAARCGWLAAQGFPAPEVVEHGDRDGFSWLVTTALPGRPISDPWPAHQAAGVVDALAGLARALHALPVAGCPFDRGLAVTVPLAKAAAAADLIDLTHLAAEYAGWSTADLVAELDRTRPDSEESVVCHGDLCTPNVLLDPDSLAVTGVLDLGRLGRADRHLDLALATRSLARANLDPARFLSRYGHPEPDPARIRFHRLLDEFF